jgi:regulator of cell morphogenesis and NO signaling
MKMADLIHANYKNLVVLSRLGIPLGFGEKTVEEVCKRYSVNVSLLLLICNVLLDNDIDPTEEQIDQCPVDQVVHYLQQSHRHYLQVALPNIQVLLDRLVDACSETHGKALNRFFNEYRQEVESHLAHEDQIVFPYVMQLCSTTKKSKFTIRQYKDHHANIETKLTDLKNIIIKYIPYDNTDYLRDELLIQLFNFEDDLNRHTLIEEKLLVPLVLHLEQLCNKS